MRNCKLRKRRLHTLDQPTLKKIAQRGSTLIISLLFLMVTTLIATGVWRLAMQQESMTGVDRDYQIAFEAAEAALRDAELDFFNTCARISTLAAGVNAVCTPRAQPIEGFTGFGSQTSGEIPPDGSCNANGLCMGKSAMTSNVKLYEARPDLAILEGTAASTLGERIPYGKYTRTPSEASQMIPLVSQQPAYLIEALSFSGNNGKQTGVMYRSTAIGYGRRADTRVLLQSYLDPN
jgi:type IV pilus assembly protein PilX